MTFIKDLINGNSKEELVLKRLHELGYQGQFSGIKDYDIVFTTKSGELKGEVKFDKMSDKTGNLAIEFFNPKLNRDSGLSATTADVWFYVFPDGTIWWAYTKELKEFIENNKPAKTFKGGGDKNADLYLYRKSFIKKVFEVL